MSFSDSSAESHVSKEYPRKRRKRSKEDQMLGVFGSDSDDNRPSRLGRKTLHDKSVAFDRAGYLSSDEDDMPRPMLGNPEKPVAEQSIRSTEAPTIADVSQAKFGFFQDASKPFIPSANPPVSSQTPYINNSRSTQTHRPQLKKRSERPVVEDAAAQKLKSGKAAQMMARMGYKSGDALGISGKGIINPLEAKLRPGQKAGLGSMAEKTDQEISEENRHGPRHEFQQPVVDSQKQERSRKTKVKYQTTKEIQEAAGGGLSIPKNLGTIIDMRGLHTKSINENGALSSTTSTTAANEVYHLAQAARQEVLRYSTDWRSLQERKTYLHAESTRCHEQRRQNIDEVQRLENLLKQVQQISQQTVDIHDEETLINRLTHNLKSLQVDLADEVEHLQLDQAAVAILAPWFRRTIAFTDILSPPPEYVDHFLSLQTILRVSTMHAEVFVNAKNRVSLPFESLMSTVWLPRFRASIGPSWSEDDSSKIISGFAVWSPLVPPYIKRQLIEQLILPRLVALIQSWNPRRSRSSKSLSWLFQWFPVLDDHVSELLTTIRHKFVLLLGQWKPEDGVLHDLALWREFIGPDSLDKVLTINLLPKLAQTLRAVDLMHFGQSTRETMLSILAWKPEFEPSIFEQLFASEFFPKWLQVLWQQLIKNLDFGTIGDWYEQWRSVFSDDLRSLTAFKRGFSKGLEMMEQTLEHGSESLPNPQSGPVRPFDHLQYATARKELRSQSMKTVQVDDEHGEISFKDVVEHWCADHNLLMMPLRKAHESGNSLYKITSSQGKTVATIFLRGDIVMRQDVPNNSFNPISLDDLTATG